MLTNIRIGNFKAFAETQRIPIRPLTLIYGANSSGKSSMLHALLFARHAMDTGELDIFQTNIGGEAVDLGGFRQYIHRRDIGRRMEWSVSLDTSRFQGRLAELLAPSKNIIITVEIGLPQVEEMREQEGFDPRTNKKIVIKVPTGNLVPAGKPEIISYNIISNGQSLLQMSKRPDGRLYLDRLNHEDIIFRQITKAIIETSTTSDTLQKSDDETISDAISEIISEIVSEECNFIPSSIARLKKTSDGGQSLLFPEKERFNLIPISKGRRREDLSSAIKLYFPRILNEIISGLSSGLKETFNNLQYLGPLRSYPPRHLAFSENYDPNWYAGGGYAWDLLRRDGRLRELVNGWLSAKNRLQTPYELRIKHLLTIDDIKASYHDIIETIEQRFTGQMNDPTAGDLDSGMDVFGEIYAALHDVEKKEERLTNIQELTLVDKRSGTNVSHRDVGIGVSQVLPVLVGAYAEKEKIIAIEQPEIHLHPALQAELGDVFIQSALGENKNRFILESHSEHLLLRIMRRIRETTSGKLSEGIPPVHPEDVMVLFVEPDASRSIIREMPLNERGELVKAWPGGFFEEGFKELF